MSDNNNGGEPLPLNVDFIQVVANTPTEKQEALPSELEQTVVATEEATTVMENTAHLPDQSATTAINLETSATMVSEPMNGTTTIANTTTTTTNNETETIQNNSSSKTSEQIKKEVEDIANKIALERATNLRKEQPVKKPSSSIIDVTRLNFDEKFQEIQELLPTTAFISFDLEMTGLEVEYVYYNL